MIDFIALLQGSLTTLSLAGCALILGLCGGICLALLETAQYRAVRLLTTLFVMLIRGLPEILVVLFVYFMAPTLLIWLSDGITLPLYFTSLTLQINLTQVDISPFACGVTALALLYAAYASQTLQGALRAIPYGQIEAGQALSLSKWHLFQRIILPQVWRHALPGLGNQWLILLKDTALVSLIAVNDIMLTTKGLITRLNDPLRPLYAYLLAGAIYLTITLLSKLILKQITRHSVRFERGE